VGARPLPADSLSGLLEPTLQRHVARTDGPRPWRVSSQIYVAILGGPLAVTAIALVNAGRLRLPDRKRLLIAAIGLLTAALAVAVMASLPEEARVLGALSGALAAGPFYLLMRSYDRAYFAFSPLDDEAAYRSLWGPGLVAVFGGWILLVLVAGALG
jgi:hypothetical protein